MFNKSIFAAVAIAAAGAAFTASANDQFAASLGVNADDFTTAELIRLRDAVEDNDTAVINFILSGQESVSGYAEGQFAASTGVEPGVYTVGEAFALANARQDEETNAVHVVVSRASGADASQNVQLARLVGVEVGALSTQDLVGTFSKTNGDTDD